MVGQERIEPMIYSLPRNQAVLDLLPRQPTSDQVQNFLDRIADGLTNRGYVLGPLKVFIGPGSNEIMVDADRDPSQEWLAFSPPVQSAKEKSDTDALAQINAVLPALRAGTASAANTQKALAWAIDKIMLRMNNGSG
jgi:hypothetical protein